MSHTGLASEDLSAPTGDQITARPNGLAPRFQVYSRRQMLKDFVIVLSLVNLSYVKVWTRLLTLTPADYFYLRYPLEPSDLVAAMLGVLLIGVAVWSLVVFVRHHVTGKLYQVCQFAFFVGAVAGPGVAIGNGVTHAAMAVRIFSATHKTLPGLVSLCSFIERLPYGRTSRLILAFAGLLILCVVVRFLSRAVHFTAVLLLCATPALIVTFAQVSYTAATRHFLLIPDGPTAPYVPVRNSIHMVWIVFDEWDYRLTFVDRAPSLQLDAVDRLRGEALFAENALPPTEDNTAKSMPSYVNGRRVEDFASESAERMRITYADTGETAIWGEQPNVFSKARDLGINTGVLGWFLPYCRVFNSSLVRCSWVAKADPANTTGSTLLQKIGWQARSILETTRFSPFGQSLSSQKHVRDYLAIDEAARDLVTDRRLGFAFAHLPGPHAPFLYNRKAKAFTRKNDMVRGYIDNLALMNRTLVHLRQALEQNGEWDNTVLLVTSDHPFRASTYLDGKFDPRIPFLLKMKGQRHGMSISTRFNAVVTGELVLAILREQVSTPEEAAGWLHQRSEQLSIDHAVMGQ